MTTQSQARIVSWSTGGEEVCASAARISTTQGDALALFEKARNNPKNQDLIGKVLRSGHRSVIEHAVFSIALQNVSVYVEQYFIECRLASFTVKSRRYVDFSGLGYYVPETLEGEALADYRKYMDGLFAAYQALLDAQVPKEDARFLLPYAFCSNFYCTLNARELVELIRSIRFGRGRGIPELRSIANQLAQQLQAMFPALAGELDGPVREEPQPEPCAPLFRDGPAWVPEAEAGAVRLLAAPANPGKLLEYARRAADPQADKPLSLDELTASPRPRELEQLSYTFAISDLTLAGVTHLVRHRMQSVIVPPIQTVDHSRFILPDTIRNNAAALEIYQAALREANRAARALCDDPALRPYSYYYAVAGNVMDVMTTLNARELKLMIRLRTCTRAQWEIRHVVMGMLRLLREQYPALFDRFGPSCYLTGVCPEGRMCCGRQEEMRALFGGKLS
ncbi:MAG: FAD-dependent thymidylate synthase [Oscillibacter sp.]|nr:FAD-dependent thymidylate synthase [Oscillibacter sp.]